MSSMALCPQGNGTTIITSTGLQYELYCGIAFPGSDLPATTVQSYKACIEACDGYSRDQSVEGGANCVAAQYGANNPNGGNCYLKYQIEAINWGDGGMSSARRIQYGFFGPPIYSEFSAIAPSSSIFPTPAPNTKAVPSSSSTPHNSPLSPTAVQSQQPFSDHGSLSGPTPTTISTSASSTDSASSLGQNSLAKPSISSSDIASVNDPHAMSTNLLDHPPATSTPTPSLGIGVKAGIGASIGILICLAFGLYLIVVQRPQRRKIRKDRSETERVEGSSETKGSLIGLVELRGHEPPQLHGDDQPGVKGVRHWELDGRSIE